MREPTLNCLRNIAGLLAVVGSGALALLVNSCATERAVVPPLHIEGATFVGNKACMDCHGKITREFPSSAHARIHLDNSQLAGQTGCESCHGPGSKHIAMGGRGGLEKFIINPGKDPTSCWQCHLNVKAEFHFPQHHPVLEGKMNCVQCHDPHGPDIMKPAGGLAMARLNESCAQCHREQTKPVMFEHPAMREGCTSCHNPHGSVNQKLLTVRDSNLCIRCHALVQSGSNVYIGKKPHTLLLRYGTCWSAGCHTAVHGSNVHVYYLY